MVWTRIKSSVWVSSHPLSVSQAQNPWNPDLCSQQLILDLRINMHRHPRFKPLVSAQVLEIHTDQV